MTLDRRAINENLETVGRWCSETGLSHAPLGKTTMSPALWREQLLAGCWAVSIANEPQLRVERGVGVPRVIVANLFLRPGGLTWLAAEMAADPGFEFLCWVDSVEAVEVIQAALAEAAASRPVTVLVELGHARARTGARGIEAALWVTGAVAAAPMFALAGVTWYEGSVAHGTDENSIAEVDGSLRQLVELRRRLLDRYEVPEPVLSAGGSAYFDRVAAVLGPRLATSHSTGPASC
jgi:D-serine deaminase-like pyridoxal phosphate-dependent protein